MLSADRIHAVWRVPVILMMTAVLATLSVVASVFDGSGRLQHLCARGWAKFIFLVSAVDIEVTGLDKLERGRGYVFMANHLSMFDHWAFLSELPFQFRFAAKASLFRIPFLGWHLRRAGNVAVDRHNPRRTIVAFKEIGDRIRAGLSFVIYPEGGRTFGDKMSEFKRGAFLLAKHAEAPIVPVTFVGAHRRLPRGSAVIRTGQMEMHIHSPIEYEDYCQQNLRAISDRVRTAIQSTYRQVEK